LRQTPVDWNATSGDFQILNKPTIPAGQVNSDWNASSGLAQILNKPTIPAAQVNSDWTASSGIAQILNLSHHSYPQFFHSYPQKTHSYTQAYHSYPQLVQGPTTALCTVLPPYTHISHVYTRIRTQPQRGLYTIQRSSLTASRL
jgi:hypothetical protein